MVVDDRCTVVDANAPALSLFGCDAVGSNLIRSYMSEAARYAIVNWPDVARAGLGKLRERLSQVPYDAELVELVRLAEATISELPPSTAPQHDEQIVCPEFRAGDPVIRTIGIAARFDSVLDVTLDELRIELLHPADDLAEQFFRGASSN